MVSSRRSLIAVVIAGSALAGANSFAQDQAIVGIATTTHYSVDGRIKTVDLNAHTVSITAADGSVRMLNVRPTVANFANTKVGDNVSLNVEDTRTFVLSGSNTKTPQPGSAAIGAAVETTQGVTGVGASQSIANWWVVGVDPAANTITLVNPGGGEVRTYDVTTPAGRQQLPRVKVGDSLTEINGRVAAVAITPKV
jgi:hypothetical protein